MTLSSSASRKKNTKATSEQISDARITPLADGGEMGALMRAFDWSQTPIGPVAAWPQSLKTAVRIILTSRFAMFVWWGQELINLYNDPYRSFLGIKHPDALGKSAREVWAEIWDQIGPRTDAVLFHGESTYDEALLLLMERYGYLEETYFTFSYSPLPDDQGNVAGLFCAVTEDTQRIVGDRRLRLLREMASAMADVRTPVQVCQAAAQSLSSAQRDLPFSLIYLAEGDGKTLKRVSQSGIASGSPGAPDLVSLDGDAESFWPLRQVIDNGEVMIVERLADHLAQIPTGEWTYAPERAVLLPIAQLGQARPAGVLIAGLNPHRLFDDEFRGFVSLLANQIAASIANAVAYDTVLERADTLAQPAREAIAISEERLRLAQTAAQMGTWEWDAAQDTRTLSPELHHIFGTDADDPHYAQVWQSRVHPADWPRVAEQMEAGTRSGNMEFEYRYHHPEHGLRWLSCRGRRLDPESRMLGVILDITGRKQVAEERERLAAIVESSDDAIVGKDLNGIVTSWNAGAERIFGYKAEEIIGRSILAIVPSELHDDEGRILETIKRGERIHHYETVRVTKGSERISVSLTISPVRDGAGRIVGAAKIARNITEQKKTEQTLHTAERLASVGRLAATVAHEINNPLEAVTNLVYLAKANAVQKNVQEYLSGAEEELERVSQLTKQTLGFYRNTKGAAPIRIGPLVEALLSMFSSRIRNKSIEIRPEIRQDPEIVAVQGEIRQLLANLLSNSIDAVEGGGFIRARVSAATDWKAGGRSGVRLTVADSGSGIPPAVRSKLFEPFFTTKKDVGTGLGLWVCKSIVEKHGGNLRVHSSARPGRSWTAFSAFLPRNPPSSLEKDLEQTV